MALDPYSRCPGGIDKKIKFCCPDLVTELETIQRMHDGEQRLACLEHIQEVEKRFPDRCCLETTKAGLQLELQQFDAAGETLSKVLSRQPNNPVALAQSAMQIAFTKGARFAVDTLQKAIEASDTAMPAEVFQSISTLAQLLLSQGEFLAGQALVTLILSIDPQSELASSLFVQVNNSAAVPVQFKEPPFLEPCPAEASWKPEFDAAVDELRRARWRVAADKFAALSSKAPQSPAVWRNLAKLRGWLADSTGAIAALRHFESLEAPLEDAVEAETLVQLLDEETAEDLVDEVQVTYTANDFDRLSAALAADRRLTRASDMMEDLPPDQPPPKAAYWLLNRPFPETAVGIAREAIPRSLARLLLFGRETDRPARLELRGLRDDLAAAQSTLGELAGDALGPAGEIEVTGQMPRLQQMFALTWRLPPDMRPNELQTLLDEDRRDVLLNAWPNTKFAMFGGRTAAEAAGGATQKIKVLAAILLLQPMMDRHASDDDFNELRRKLGLPELAPIDPQAMPDRVHELDRLPLVRLHRLVTTALTDEELANLFQRALLAAVKPAVRRLGHEIVSRASWKGPLDKQQVLSSLVAIENDADRAIGYVEQGRKLARDAGQSCARWDLEELSLRLDRYEIEPIGRIVRHLQETHIREPGVSRAMMEMLIDAGILRPDGTPAAMPAADAGPGLVLPGGAEPAPAGQIWTPGSEAGPAKKSALWMPGME
jgi:hypothetical protein